MIMAGGTGGHVFPALSLASWLQARNCEVVWLGTRAGIEARLVPAAGIEVEWIDIGGLRGKGLSTLLAAPLRLLRALWQALAAVRRHRPRVVVGLGGYVTGPGGLAAWLSRRPLVIHEQNAIAGFTNRTLAKISTRVLEAFAGSFGANVKTIEVGNPVRADFFALAAPATRYASRGGPLQLLIVGGSQGAQRLNNVVPAAIAQLAAGAVRVRHQSGTRMLEITRQAYRSHGIEAEVSAFIDDIAEALHGDLVDPAAFWDLFLREQGNAVRGRRRAETERQIMGAWWLTRMRGEAETKGSVKLQDYLDVLLTDAERAERVDRAAEQLMARFDELTNINWAARLEEAGMTIAGTNPDGSLVEIVELADHPWFVAVQFHPEFKSKPTAPHPLFTGLIAAAVERHAGSAWAAGGT